MAEKPEEKAKSPNTEPSSKGSTPQTQQLDETVFGLWGARLRNFSGFLAVLTVCAMTLIYVWTIHESVIAGNGWPDRMSLAIITIPVALVALSFSNVGKLLRVIIDSDEGRSALDKVADAVRAFKGQPPLSKRNNEE